MQCVHKVRNKNTRPGIKAVKRMLPNILQRWALANWNYNSPFILNINSHDL